MLSTKDLHLCLPVFRQPVEFQASVPRPRDVGLVKIRSAMFARSVLPLRLSRRRCPDFLLGDLVLCHLPDKMRSGGAVPSTEQLSHRRSPISHSQQRPRAAVICAAALESKCSAGQTQTVERQSSSTTISILGPGMEKTPKLEKGGDGGPPGDGGGGGGGGGGGSSSGGFFLFAFILFLKFLRDKEREKEKEYRSTPLEEVYE